MFKKSIILVILASILLVQATNAFADANDFKMMTGKRYGLPRWQFKECGDEHQSKFNTFSNSLKNQIKCVDNPASDKYLRCGDSRVPLCNSKTDTCVTVEFSQDSANDFELNKALSLVLDENWDPTNFDNTDYDFPTITDGNQITYCKPSDMNLPSAPSCSDITSGTIAPNFTAWQNKFWGKCGHDETYADQHAGQAYNFYCTHPEFAFCDTDTKTCRNNQSDWYPELSDDDKLISDELSLNGWKASDCYVSSLEQGTLSMELALWIYSRRSRNDSINKWVTKLNVAINTMRANWVLSEQYTTDGEEWTLVVKYPRNCPEPPTPKVPSIVTACVDAAATAKKISRSMASVDGAVVDNAWKNDLKNQNYKMLSQMTKCTNEKEFPCDERVLAFHPKEEDHALHCFNTTTMTASVSIDHDCFEGSLSRKYYDQYIQFLIVTAEKWKKTLQEDVWPGKVCSEIYHKQDDRDPPAYFMNNRDVLSQCLAQRVECEGDALKYEEHSRAICGTIGCCDDAINGLVSNFECIYTVNDGPGSWDYTLKQPHCPPEAELCPVKGVTVDLFFHFVKVSEGITIKTANRTIIGLEDADIIAKLQQVSTSTMYLCRENTTALQMCGMSPSDENNGFTTGHLGYCMSNECCVGSDQSGLNYICKANTSESCTSEDAVFKNSRHSAFNNSGYQQCVSENTPNALDNVQVSMQPGDVTTAGEANDLINAPVIPIQPSIEPEATITVPAN